jgi:hypothetical protein
MRQLWRSLRSGGDALQNAFESSGLVLRNPILLLSILAISGIARSGTSPACTPAATDFSRASCPGLKSRCLSGLGCRTSGSPQPHRQHGFWNQSISVTAWDLRRAQARFIDSLRVSDFMMLFCSFAIRDLPVSEARQVIETQGDYDTSRHELGAPLMRRSLLGGCSPDGFPCLSEAFFLAPAVCPAMKPLANVSCQHAADKWKFLRKHHKGRHQKVKRSLN